jgi:hypothetical protein
MRVPFQTLGFVVAIGASACGNVEPVSLGSSDPCAGTPDPAESLFGASTPTPLAFGEGLAVDDFVIDGEDAVVAFRPRAGVVESVISRIPITGGEAVEIARVRNASAIAVTSMSIYFQETADSTRGKQGILNRMSKTGGSPERVELPGDPTPNWLLNELRADAADNVFTVRVFGGHYGLVMIDRRGEARRVSPEGLSVESTGISDTSHLFALASPATGAPAGRNLVDLGFDATRGPVTLVGPGNYFGITTDDANVYVSAKDAIVRVPKQGGASSKIPFVADSPPLHMVVAGGYVYGDFQRNGDGTANGTKFTNLGRLPLSGGPLEPLAGDNVRKVALSRCYVVWRSDDAVHARRR